MNRFVWHKFVCCVRDRGVFLFVVGDSPGPRQRVVVMGTTIDRDVYGRGNMIHRGQQDGRRQPLKNSRDV